MFDDRRLGLGGGAGIQADLKAFAAAGCYGMSAIVALTAQNTTGVTAVHECRPVRSRTAGRRARRSRSRRGEDGMLFSREVIETVADTLAAAHVPLVVDPVMIASSGARLLRDDAVETLVRSSLSACDRRDAEPSGGRGPGRRPGSRRELAERIHDRGAPAVVVTGGHGDTPVDHLFDGERHVEIPVDRHDVAATHGAGCTHSATLAAGLARGLSLEEAAREAARVASEAVRNGLAELGAGDGPVDVLHLKGAA